MWIEFDLSHVSVLKGQFRLFGGGGVRSATVPTGVFPTVGKFNPLFLSSKTKTLLGITFFDQ